MRWQVPPSKCRPFQLSNSMSLPYDGGIKCNLSARGNGLNLASSTPSRRHCIYEGS